MNTSFVYRLARANGCDQPESARASIPKTPAAREQGHPLVGAGRKPAGASPCASVHCGGEVA